VHIEIHNVEHVGNRLLLDLEYDEEFYSIVAKVLGKKNVTQAQVQRYILNVIKKLDWDSVIRS
jgi:hypothetical protein